MANGLLIDTTKCIGCGECSRACAEANHLPESEMEVLSASRYTAVKEVNDGETYVRKLCMHCVEPTCVSACLVGAFRKTAGGAVLYDEDKCIGCRYCMQACPFSVPRYEWSSLAPRIQKCNFCSTQTENGRVPACAEACPVGATLFGDREALIAEGKKRIRENPDQYVDHLYGVTEAGGTSVMFLAGIPFEQLGLPMNLPDEPIPKLSWKILREIPRYAVVASMFLFGVHWITARRKMVARLESNNDRQGTKK